MFKTLKEAQAWIESVEKFGQKYDLTRMQNACAMLGNPQNSFKSIHIGGTNGKGSTLSYMKESLIAAGYNVGTFISPYIVHFNERITVNHAMISDEDLLYYINQIYAFQTQYLAKYQDQITFFELLTLISFQYFKDQPVDIVLYEVGLGGTLDATNVITPIMSLIVSIGYDHMAVLGNTLTSIAKNKLGIVKPKVPLIHSIKQPHLKPLINSHANMMAAPVINARMHRLTNITHTPNIAFNLQGVTYSIRMRGAHQIDNARLAITALTHLNHLGYHVHTKHIQTGLTRAFMPGRFEAFKPHIYLDGAHNISGLKASLNTLELLAEGRPKTIVFAVMADKDYAPMLNLLESVASTLVLTEIPTLRSEKAEVLYAKVNHPHKKRMPDYKDVYDLIKDDPCVLITGSLYFISMIRQALSNENRSKV